LADGAADPATLTFAFGRGLRRQWLTFFGDVIMIFFLAGCSLHPEPVAKPRPISALPRSPLIVVFRCSS